MTTKLTPREPTDVIVVALSRGRGQERFALVSVPGWNESLLVMLPLRLLNRTARVPLAKLIGARFSTTFITEAKVPDDLHFGAFRLARNENKENA